MYTIQISQMRSSMIWENINSAFILCFIMFLEIGICVIIPTMTSRILLVISQFMPFPRFAFLILYHHWLWRGRVVTVTVYKYLQVELCNALYMRLVSKCAANHGTIWVLRDSWTELLCKFINRHLFQNV